MDIFLRIFVCIVFIKNKFLANQPNVTKKRGRGGWGGGWEEAEEIDPHQIFSHKIVGSNHILIGFHLFSYYYIIDSFYIFSFKTAYNR